MIFILFLQIIIKFTFCIKFTANTVLSYLFPSYKHQSSAYQVYVRSDFSVNCQTAECHLSVI